MVQQEQFIGKFNPINYCYDTPNKKSEELSLTIDRKIKEEIKNLVKQENFSSKSLNDKFNHLEEIILKVLSNESDFIHLIPGDTRFPANFISLKHHCSYVAGISSLLSIIILEQFFIAKFGKKEEAEKILTEKHIMDFDKLDIPEFGTLLKEIYETDLDITPKQFILINRIAGLLHDIAKPDLKDHDTNSANRTENYLTSLKIDQKIINVITEIIAHHHPFKHGKELVPRLSIGIVTAADYIATSERSALFNPDFYELVLSTIANDEWELKTLFEKKDINVIKESIKNQNYNVLKGISVVSRKMYRENQHFNFFNLTKDAVESHIVYEIFRKLQEEINKKLGLKIDFINGKYLSFFYAEFKGIQKFIFRSQKLKIIKNSSLLVQYINDLMKNVFRDYMGRSLVISSGGGNIIGLCSISEIDSLKKLVCDTIKQDSLLKEVTDDIMKRVYFRPFLPHQFKFAFPELFFGLECTGYDFEQLFGNLDFKKKYEEQDEKTQDLLAYYDVSENDYNYYNSTIKEKDGKNRILFDLLVKFVQKKGFGELVSYYFDLPEFKKFNELEEDLSNLEFQCKNRKPEFGLCELCNESIAIKNIKELDGKERQVCNLCLNLMNSNLTRDSDLSSFTNAISDGLKENSKTAVENFTFPNELDEIIFDVNARSSIKDPAMNNMAMITMDGNNIGVMKSRLNILSLYQEFSELLDINVKNILSKSIISIIKDPVNLLKRSKDGKLIIPIIPLILGGDDITILVRSDLAFPIIREFFKKIEEDLFGYPILMTRKNKNLEFFKTNYETDEEVGYLNRFEKDEEKNKDIISFKSDPEKYNLDNFKASFYPTGFGAGVFIADQKSPIGRVFTITSALESKSKELCKRTLENLKKSDNTCILGGAWNTVAFHYTTTQDLSRTYLERYYSDNYGAIKKADVSGDKKNYAYKICQFPLFSFELNNFMSIVSELSKNISKDKKGSDSKQISLNELKELIRTVEIKSPNENKLNIYYKIGKMLGRLDQNDPKVILYKKILELFIRKTARTIHDKNNQHDQNNQKNSMQIYLVPLYDFVHYLPFIENTDKNSEKKSKQGGEN